MKVKGLLILLGTILLLQSCAPTEVTKMAAVASRDQKVGYQDTITSQKKHFVSLSPYTELNVAKDKTMFMMVIQNYGESSIKIGYDNVSVTFEGTGENRSSDKINVQPFDDFMEDLEGEYSYNEKRYIESALEDIQLDLETASSFESLDSLDSFSSSDDSSSSDSSDSSDSTSDDVEFMIEDLNYDIETMRTNNQLLREALQEFIMKPQTIMPDDNYTKVVVLDTSDMDPEREGDFQIVVSVENEAHKFTFKRSLNK